MKILFYPCYCLPLHRNILDEKPLGGTETGIIRLSEALADEGHQIFIVSQMEDLSANPSFVQPKQLPLLKGIDLAVVIRGWQPVFTLPVERKKTVYWTGDAADTFHNYGIGDLRVHKHIDALLCVSEWQAGGLCQTSGFPPQKVWILRNGVHMPYFSGLEMRQKKRLIYTAHPSRGLEHVPFIFKALKDKYPDLELHLFGGSATHGRNEEAKWQTVFDALKKLPGCFVHGAVCQRILSCEMMRSAIWIYPTAFCETSCMSAMEAQAAGCAIVTSALAALNETVGSAGILLREPPGSQQYLCTFIHEVDKILSDEKLLTTLSYKALENAKTFSWKLRAKGFLNYLKSVHQLE